MYGFRSPHGGFWSSKEILVTATVVLLLTSLTLVNVLRPASQSGPTSAAHEHATGGIFQAKIVANSSFATTRPRFILFGDSLTERSFDAGGWGSSLASRYVRKVDIINRGFSGYNTFFALNLLDEIFGDTSEKDTALVTVFFGANDAAIPMPDGMPTQARLHVPVSNYKDNLKLIVKFIQDRGISHIILLTPPPVYDEGRMASNLQRLEASEPQASEPLVLDRASNVTQLYAQACEEVGRALELPVVDLWTAMQREEGWGPRFFNDGLHFTPEGNAAVFELLSAAINATYQEIRPENLPLHFPPFHAFYQFNATEEP